MKKIFMVILVLVVFTMGKYAAGDTIVVPRDFPTIQQGIDHSLSYWDTVLVYPGLYEENIVLNDVGLIIASLFITSSDTSYINQTVIDGGGAGPVFYMNGHGPFPNIITGFTIRNGYYASGGGFYGHDSYMYIISNTVVQNAAAQDGGAIALFNSSALDLIKGNKITDNSCPQRGGGIYIENGNLTINENKIENNSGCGVYCINDNSAVIDNIIANNNGGGFRAVFFYGELRGNIIYGNSIQGYGGGVYAGQNSNLSSRNNTIAFNYADNGGGVYSDDGSYFGRSCIFYANQADNNPQLGESTPSELHILYSLIEGGWNGIGNIDTDPLFVDQDNFDFHLQAESPCIDSGDPSSPEDPDGTRADMGALYYDHRLPVLEDQSQRDADYGFWFDSTQTRWQEFEPTLENLAVVDVYISKTGAPGDLIMAILSADDVLISTDTVAEANIPVNNWLEIRLSDAVDLSPGESYKIRLSSDRVSSSPENRYIWRGSLDSDYPGITDVYSSWPDYDYAFITYGYSMTGFIDYGHEPNLFSLHTNYPNPFNVSTKIGYDLSRKSYVKLCIYDILGRQVQTMYDGQQTAGYHQVTWNGEIFPSGMYFYKLQAGDYSETKKMILIK